MSKKMLIDAVYPEETRVAILNEKQKIEDFDFENHSKKQLRGDIYLAKVSRVEPSLQAVFVEYGGNRQGFLAFNEIHPDYYQIPYEDRIKLLEAEEALQTSEDEEPEELAKSGEEGKESPEKTLQNPDSDTDEDIEDTARKRQKLLKRYKVQEVIKRRQIILVQVVKEERGNKGAALTTYLSLAGRYCVLMPNTPRGGGVSRKITNINDRKRLKSIIQGLEVPDGMGLIIRTAGSKRTKAEIKRDYDYLIRLWHTIRENTLQAVAPALIHEEGSLVKRAIRDLYDRDINIILVEGDKAYREAKNFIRMLMPSHAKKVQPYHRETNLPIFSEYKLEEQLDIIYHPVVALSSGGYIVIHITEALVAIDVNSGRSTKERNIEKTALKTNLEAAEEIARQMRLRDLAGLIVIDFIDMEESKNNRTIENKVKEALRNDRARIQFERISPFGLMEISRQRRRIGILEMTSETCSKCQGTGYTRSEAPSVLRALREIEQYALHQTDQILTLHTRQHIALHLLNRKRDTLKEIETRYKIKIEIEISSDLEFEDYILSSNKNPKNRQEKSLPNSLRTRTSPPEKSKKTSAHKRNQNKRKNNHTSPQQKTPEENSQREKVEPPKLQNTIQEKNRRSSYTRRRRQNNSPTRPHHSKNSLTNQNNIPNPSGMEILNAPSPESQHKTNIAPDTPSHTSPTSIQKEEIKKNIVPKKDQQESNRDTLEQKENTQETQKGKQQKRRRYTRRKTGEQHTSPKNSSTPVSRHEQAESELKRSGISKETTEPIQEMEVEKKNNPSSTPKTQKAVKRAPVKRKKPVSKKQSAQSIPETPNPASLPVSPASSEAGNIPLIAKKKQTEEQEKTARKGWWQKRSMSKLE